MYIIADDAEIYEHFSTPAVPAVVTWLSAVEDLSTSYV